MNKKIISLILALICFSTSVHASILGSILVDSSSLLIANDTVLYKNTFYSDQSGVGYQNEYYAEYTPNDKIRPVVITGESIWGKRTINEAINYMQDNNLYPMIGINASFFSLQTGVPMGHVITNGEITSKDTTILDAVGFRKDGTAFISSLGITTTAYFDEYEFDIAHVNKYSQPTTEVMTLFTDEFGTNNQSKSEAVNIILGDIEGKFSLGETLTAKVEEIVTTSEAVEIPEGKIVLTINTIGNQWILSLMNILTVGEKITIKNNATSDAELWNEAYNAIASEGKRLLINGEVNPKLETGAAPRTAVGITSDGNLIFYVIDGRQPNYSYGVKQSTLAIRLKELGCVDAINLDGGGSTTIAGIYPGQSSSAVINSPSDGNLRKVTNFIFLQNLQEKSDKIGGLYLYPYSGHYLSGSTIQLQAGAIDSSFYYTDLPEVSYSMGNELGDVTQDGVLTLKGTGEAVVNVSAGEISGGASFFTYENPSSIEVYNVDTGKKIESLTDNVNASYKLEARAYQGKKYLNSTPEMFSWSIDEDLGTIENGTLTLSTKAGATGKLYVKVGETVKEIPITIKKPDILPIELYPYSETVIEDNKLKISIFSFYESLDMEECYVSVDGRIYDITFDMVNDKHSVAEIPLTELDDFHKISIYSKTVDGYASLHSEIIKNVKLTNNFGDTKNHWAEDVISYMNSKNIVNGSEGCFYPDNDMTRAEFAVMMCGFLGLDVSQYRDKEITFKDNDIIPAWAINYIKAVSDMGIISGRQDGESVLFAPNDKITRAEAATVIGRVLPENLRKGEINFADEKDIPAWAKDYIAILKNAGFMNGYPDNTIQPGGNLTRAEAVTMLFNIY